MQMLSEDDLNLRDMTPEELEKAWDLWFTLAQTTNDDDPPYTHGVLTSVTWEDLEEPGPSGSGESTARKRRLSTESC